MDYRDRLIKAIANEEAEQISQSVIRQLCSMRDGMLQSGDDSGLENVWDEICVQVQGEQSVLWDAYTATVEMVIAERVRKLALSLQEAIWLQTDNGFDWIWEVDNADEDQPSDQSVPVADDDIVAYILDRYVLSAASDWSNDRINQYLYGSSEDDDEDDEFDS